MRLKHYIDLPAKSTKLTLADTRKIIRSVISATSYCHENNVIVRNLTADNIMVKSSSSGNFEVMICDFSLAVPIGSTKVLCDHALFEWTDVPYMAPEALLGHPYSTSMDVWSIGVMLYMMVSGELPFESEDDKELVAKIASASLNFPVSNPIWCPENDRIKYLISDLLKVNPTERPVWKEIMKSPFVMIG